MKRTIRVLLITTGVVLLFLIVPQLILSFPGFLFSEKQVHNNFIVLSDEPIAPPTSSALDSIVVQLRSTGFYNNMPITIVLCNSDGKSAFLDKISMTAPGAGFHHFSGNIFLHPKRIEQFRLENSKATGEELMLIEHSYQAFEFQDILTHEILHKLHADTMGIWEFRRKLPPPHWKAEGFAEYYTHRDKINEDTGQNFKQQCALYLKYKDKFPLFYLRSRLLYEYLVVYEHLSFEEIMSDEIDESQTFAKLNEMAGRHD